MENPDLELLKTTICMKDHEIFNLRSELERKNHEVQSFAVSIERLEKTMATCYDRLLRRLERSGLPVDQGTRKRRRH